MKRYINRHLLVLGTLLSISTLGMGQEVAHHVTGTLVSDDQNTPMESAEVLVSDMSANTIKSVLTDEKGSFLIDLEKGIYVFRYRELGEILKQDTINIQSDMYLGIIKAPIANKTLQELTVVGMKKIITFDQNKLVYSVKNSPYANGFNAKDVILNVPGINPTKPDEVSLIGKA